MEKTRLEKKIEKWIIMKIVKYFKLSSKTEKWLVKLSKHSTYNNKNYKTNTSYDNETFRRFEDDLHENPAYKDIPCNIWHQS
ncbi:hypothetical protein DMB95_06915 [Campylobacter sp. MIT 12-8780]|uniref:hypothetical protein n=1 Tax=unclassified Campylobacter TaxID=2593542 RepID=UPI00115DBBBF|nr:MULTISPECIES: hypothetical protein [unclassified Campylobacter]NDJ27693.1 hypothetical protein [Campylobacter sp. MIT 19-121]TQR40857.1 hypothetical protein DMB95_06915 [Campylobacter sp. MIT 12-8780]